MRDCVAGAAGMNRANPLLPALFVLLWSTGFVGAKYGLPYADPFTLLALRMVLAAVLLGLLAAALRSVAMPAQRAYGDRFTLFKP